MIEISGSSDEGEQLADDGLASASAPVAAPSAPASLSLDDIDRLGVLGQLRQPPPPAPKQRFAQRSVELTAHARHVLQEKRRKREVEELQSERDALAQGLRKVQRNMPRALVACGVPATLVGGGNRIPVAAQGVGITLERAQVLATAAFGGDVPRGVDIKARRHRASVAEQAAHHRDHVFGCSGRKTER